MEKPKVLVTRCDVPEPALKKLRDLCEVDIFEGAYPIPRDQLKARVAGKDGLFCFLTDPITPEILDAADMWLHTTLYVLGQVGHTPFVSTDAVAELTVALLLATSRRLLQANAEITNGGWAQCVWGPVYMLGKGLTGSTVGIFGLGRIGQAVLKRLSGFSVAKFLYADFVEQKLDSSFPPAEFVSFERLLQESDFVICMASLTDQTRAKFNKEVFTAMKNSAVFINASRGGLVDQDALVWALQTGQIWAAGLDVMNPEPLPADHVLNTLPNCSELNSMTVVADLSIQFSVESARFAMAELAADNLIGGLFKDKQMVHSVN
ncbi:hypothetical protein HAZT_HAZT001562 [Hyalella azteca]|uniref:Glyoxylate reductase/hydroxypyruvate reductase n=1 Tax=Hyalella azteca TaxID=294128 RepID=A0A6A0GXQ3_HYAAZ|nr:hypothetical protein HAZT_HAZT001562 [Hyalella azteca]